MKFEQVIASQVVVHFIIETNAPTRISDLEAERSSQFLAFFRGLLILCSKNCVCGSVR